MNTIITKKMASRLAAGGVPAVLALIGSTAHAQMPAEVTTAITSAGTNLATAAVAIIAALAAFWGLRILGKKLGLWGN